MQGQQYEALAQSYLLQAGCQLMAVNYQTICGEIDLIVQDGDELAFVEVRYRSRSSHGDGASTVTIAKQRKIIKAAKHYLVCQGKYDKIACRFDVISIDSNLNIEWLKHAFELSHPF